MTKNEFLQKWLGAFASEARKDELIRDVFALLTPPDNNLSFNSTVSHRDMRPLVDVKLGSYSFQVDPQQARRLGAGFLEAAFAAETDAFIFQEFRNKMGLPDETIWSFIQTFREWRENTAMQREQKGPVQ